MKEVTTSKTAAGVGLFAAIAASLCCITPVLALLAGASGAASSLSWLAPVRPYLIGLAIATLGFAWYRSLSTKERTVCGPDGSCKVEKKPFLSSRTFLTIITISAIVLMAFPYYANIFYPKAEKQNVLVVESNNIQSASFSIKGMSCKACETEVNNELYKVSGVINAQTYYAKGTSIVKFDKSKASVEQLKSAIAKTGYEVTNYQLLNN
ncbi:mercuric transport protein MerTP [Niabella sp. W65]|jgi:copper chaperone CopZ|nr:mercuric transport protein MerTP [Bacteroidota bacterium]MCH5688845.1 mercuric transport protein MerTP [Niabella sp. W65]MCH7367347.1 mercuric transport protein MerTP [Niabella sp. W65]ULT43007.1 mercuric transport protein MerTP [Niabella sp. I65]